MYNFITFNQCWKTWCCLFVRIQLDNWLNVCLYVCVCVLSFQKREKEKKDIVEGKKSFVWESNSCIGIWSSTLQIAPWKETRVINRRVQLVIWPEKDARTPFWEIELKHFMWFMIFRPKLIWQNRTHTHYTYTHKPIHMYTLACSYDISKHFNSLSFLLFSIMLFALIIEWKCNKLWSVGLSIFAIYRTEPFIDPNEYECHD